ncbi:MAG: hypothetical protein IM613_17405, partial [Cytophagales bacterium]|nr:hypothetical protein [Cytophagales bacterium]
MNLYRNNNRIEAANTLYRDKDAIKAMGFVWDSDARVWWTDSLAKAAAF